MTLDEQTQRQVEDLHDLLEISRAMIATTDLDDLFLVITSYASKMLDAERATLFLYDPETEELRSRVAQGVEEIRFPATKGVAGYVVRTGKTLNIPDAYADSRFNPEIDRQTGFRTRNLLALPLYSYDEDLVGVLEIVNKRKGAFDEYDTSICGALAAQAGVVLQRARLMQHYKDKLRIEQALEIAREIQADLLPGENPAVPGFEIVGWNLPCDEVGGDCYDFFSLEDGRLVISIGDATGHGVGPALVSAEARAALRGLSWSGHDLGQIVNRANVLLAGDLAGERFVTMFIGILDPSRGRLEYASAGQAPILFFGDGGTVVNTLEATGLPLGMMGDMEIPLAEPLEFQSGDILVLLTDGFYEWEREDGEQLGVERVVQAVRQHVKESADSILGAVRKELYAFSDTPQDDDLTAIVIKKI